MSCIQILFLCLIVSSFVCVIVYINLTASTSTPKHNIAIKLSVVKYGILGLNYSSLVDKNGTKFNTVKPSFSSLTDKKGTKSNTKSNTTEPSFSSLTDNNGTKSNTTEPSFSSLTDKNGTKPNTTGPSFSSLADNNGTKGDSPEHTFSQLTDIPKDRRLKPGTKPTVALVVGVLSKLPASDRRSAVRRTWFQVCERRNRSAACRIFTDHIDVDEKNHDLYWDEYKNNTDMVIMPFKGFNFGLRLVWMFEYFTRHFDFEFFLRVDDDYFLCLDRLLNELPYRQKHGLYWGWLHCENGIVRIDEGFMILTHDFINETLHKRNTTLMCSLYGDQSVPLWIKDSRIPITWFPDNSRIEHRAYDYHIWKYAYPELCDSHIAVHRAYPEYMYRYWELTERGYNANKTYHITNMTKYDAICPYKKILNYKNFAPTYYSVPQLCKNTLLSNNLTTYDGRTPISYTPTNWSSNDTPGRVLIIARYAVFMEGVFLVFVFSLTTLVPLGVCWYRKCSADNYHIIMIFSFLYLYLYSLCFYTNGH